MDSFQYTRRTSLAIMRSVVFALMMREMKTRFGAYRLGYFWALLEPGIHVAVFAILFGVILQKSMPGMNYTLFVVTGVIPWLMFNNMLSRGMSAVSANAGLFGYRQVKPMDSFVARMMLEGLIHFAVFLVFLLIMEWIGVPVTIANPLGVLAALLLLFIFSFGLSLIVCIVVTQYPEIQKIVPIVTRPLYFMSGIFFSINHIPPRYRDYFMWNPVLHANELGRDAFFSAYRTPAGSWEYLTLVAVLAVAFGMALYRQNNERLVTT